MTARILFSLALTAALLGAVITPALAQPVAKLMPAESEIKFTTRQMGVPVEGRFQRFTAQVALDPKAPAGGSVSFEIDTGSASFGAPELDGEVPKPTWLAAARFPKATFKSTAIQASGSGKFQVTGKLEIKGASQNIVVPVQLTQSGSGATLSSTASGSFSIKRLDFKIGEAEWSDTSLLANDVLVQFKLKLTGLPPL